MVRKEMGKAPTSLGRTLVKYNATSKSSARRSGAQHNAVYHNADDEDAKERIHLESVMERNALDEFLTTAMMKEQEFTAQRSQVIMVGGNTIVQMESKEPVEELEYEHIRIPRRPRWDANTAPDELLRQERENFLTWRRELAKYEEHATGKHATPFEKNLEVWKQLWRVVERSHVVCQIVDARNPLLYYCDDLVSLAKELDSRKRCVLVVNKADFLTQTARKLWADYFTSKGIEFVFWSAKEESELQAEKARAEERRAALVERRRELEGLGDNEDDERGGEEEGDDEEEEEEGEDEEEGEEEKNTEADDKAGLKNGDTSESKMQGPNEKIGIAGHEALLNFFKSKADTKYVSETYMASKASEADAAAGPKVVVGMVGFPNVGKSSTINALVGAKKVSVAATPGHTKHFQTLNLGSDITLCDCPGLVFPTFVQSHASLVVNGVIPIDTLRDFISPVNVLAQQVSRSQLIQTYGLDIPPELRLDGMTLLTSHARMRNFFKDHGRPDETRSARLILKDYVNGKLLYCQCPPGLIPSDKAAFYSSFRGKFNAVGSRQVADSLQSHPDAAIGAGQGTAGAGAAGGGHIGLDAEAPVKQGAAAGSTVVISSGAGAREGTDIGHIEVDITRTKIYHAKPEEDAVPLTSSGGQKRDIDVTKLTRKQLLRLQKQMLKGKIGATDAFRVGAGGTSEFYGRADRGPGEVLAARKAAAGKGAILTRR